MRITAAATAALLAAATTLTVQAAPSPSSSSSHDTIHLLRRRSGRKAGVPLHEHLNNERAKLKNKYHRNHARVQHNERRRRGELSEGEHEMDKRDGFASFGTVTNTLYYAGVTVGTPAKTFPVGIDTGSSDLWISGQNWAGASASSTFQRNGQVFSVDYEDGTSVQGYQGTDKVSFAGYSATTALSVGTQLSKNAAPAPADGIFGFGWPVLATNEAKPFWITSGANVFSMYLASTSDFNNEYSYGGVIHLGTPNSSFYTGSINYVPITSQVYWTIILQALNVGGSSVNLKSNQQAVIDSGTSLIGAPDDVVTQFYANVPNARSVPGSQGFYEYPCTNSNLGISMTYGGQSYAIPDENFVFDTDSGGYCVGALFSNGNDGSASDSQFIVGDSFLRGNIYTIFNGPKSAVGFATLSPNAPTTGPDYNQNGGSNGSNATGSGSSSGNGNSGSGNGSGSGGGGLFGGIFGAASPRASTAGGVVGVVSVVGASVAAVLGAAFLV